MKTLVRSFAGGEVSPRLFGRIDLTQYQTGAALMENFRPTPQGAAESRAGFEYIFEANHVAGPFGTQPVRLAPFVFSDDQAAVLEFSSGKIRFYIDGSVLLNTPLAVTGYTQAAPAVFTRNAHGYSNGTVVFVDGSGAPDDIRGRQCTIEAATTNTFQLAGMDGTLIDGSLFPAFTGPVNVASVYEVSTPYTYEEVFLLDVVQNNDVLTITSQLASRPAKELRRLGPTNWQLVDATFGSALTAPGAPTVTPTAPTTGNQQPCVYVVTSTDGLDESPASASTSVNNDLSIAGNYNTVSWTSTGAPRYNIFKQKGGTFGYIGQTTSTSIIDNNIDPDTTITPPESNIALNDTVDNQPRAACYHEQRRWFAGTNVKPQTVFATRTGLDNNLTESVPHQPADAFEIRLAATQRHTIRHLVPLNDLWALTASGVFRLFAADNSALSAETITIKPRGSSGASAVQPALTNDSFLYVQTHGARIREVSYNRRNLESYANDDLSIAAGHLFRSYTIKQLAFSSEPDPTLWAVRSDGVLLSLTLLPEQEVRGWARHVTNGAVESVAVVPEQGTDRVYVCVKREVDGRTARYVERLDARDFADISEAFFVDSGLRLVGAAETELGGLWHLEGKSVNVLIDGAVHPSRVVTGGKITIDEPVVTRACVGLPLVARLKTLPLVNLAAEAGGTGAPDSIGNVQLRVEQSSQVKAGPSFDNLQAFSDRDVADFIDAPPPFVDGLLEVLAPPAWQLDACVCVQQDLPLPLTVVALIMEANR